MKKGLVTAFVIASVLAFNACKKEEGPQGPKGDKGDKGDAGAPGAQGPIGLTGAAGKDGATIRSGAGAPASTTGNDGDFYFDTDGRELYGPKASGAWPAAGTSLLGPAGPAGKDGKDGKDGSSLIAGPGGTTTITLPADIKTGDYFFNTDNSTVYGPIAADGTWANAYPIGSGKGMKTYYISLGLKVTDDYITPGEDVIITGKEFDVHTTYDITAEDLIRINQYTGVSAAGDVYPNVGWKYNREMIFESTPGSNIFDIVPRGAFDFADPSDPSGMTPAATVPTWAIGGSRLIKAGAEFRYSHNLAYPYATFNLTEHDIDRLSVNNGANFGHLTYGIVKDGTYETLGSRLIIARQKHIEVSNVDAYYAEYDAVTEFDFATAIPEIDRIKQDGLVLARVKFLSDKAGDNKPLNHYNWPTWYLTGDAYYGEPHDAAYGNQSAGWQDLTWYLDSYVNDVAYNQGNNQSGHTLNVQNPFYELAFAAPGYTRFGGNAYFGNVGTVYHYAPTQTATVVTGPGSAPTSFNNGKWTINWRIRSGVNHGLQWVNYSPNFLANPGGHADPVTRAYYELRNNVTPSILTGAFYTDRIWDRKYYATVPGSTDAQSLVAAVNSWISTVWWLGGYVPPALPEATLFANRPFGTALTQRNSIQVNLNNGGQPVDYFEKHNFLQIQVRVIDSEVVRNAKAAGIDVNNPEALVNFANSLQLQ